MKLVYVNAEHIYETISCTNSQFRYIVHNCSSCHLQALWWGRRSRWSPQNL